MSALMTEDDIHYSEKWIYLPMVISMLYKERLLANDGNFKLKRPDPVLVDQAIKCAEKDLRITKTYLKNRKLKIIKSSQDDLATEYIFFYNGHEDYRKYLHYQMRNRTEELMDICLAKVLL